MFIFIKVKCIIVCEQEFLSNDYFGVKQFTFVSIILNATELHEFRTRNVIIIWMALVVLNVIITCD